MQNRGFIGVCLTVLACLGASSGCSKHPDDRAIANLVGQLQRDMEELKYSAVIDELSPDYSDNVGNDRTNLEARFRRMFHRFSRLEIRHEIIQIERQGLTALAKLKLKVDGFDGSRKERLFGHPLRASEVHLHLEKRGERWRVVGTTVVRKRGIF